DAGRRLFEELRVGHAAAFAIQMALILLVAPRVPGHVFGRAVERGAVRRAEGRNEPRHQAAAARSLNRTIHTSRRISAKPKAAPTISVHSPPGNAPAGIRAR